MRPAPGTRSAGCHASGYALRFPRIVRVRPDRSPENTSTLRDVARLAAALAVAKTEPEPAGGRTTGGA